MYNTPHRNSQIRFSLTPSWLRLILATVFFCSLSGKLFAHEVRPAVVDLNLGEQSYTIEILLNLEAVMAGIEPKHTDTSESANAPEYNALRALSPGQLGERFAVFQPGFLDAIEVQDGDGATVRHAVTSVDIEGDSNLEVARDSRITLTPIIDRSFNAVSWSWDESFGTSIVRVNGVDGEASDDAYSAFLQSGERSELIPLSGEISLSLWGVIKNYLVVGFTHILPKGLDHILFVIGLFLLSPALRPLLIQITSFTVAHTVTLALGSLGIVTLSPSIVEPLIAASIVYVAIENLMTDRLQRWRPVIVFGFGLLHGLGFAGVLAEVGIAKDFFVTALISFNVGVELGQLAVVAICLVLFGWLRGHPRYRQIVTIPLSLVIAAIGAYWFIERVFLG